VVSVRKEEKEALNVDESKEEGFLRFSCPCPYSLQSSRLGILEVHLLTGALVVYWPTIL
jgi:hypothetical protein